MENTIEIETVDGKALKTLIDFIYTSSITINEQNVKDLLSGALLPSNARRKMIQFRVSSLQYNCRKFFRSFPNGWSLQK